MLIGTRGSKLALTQTNMVIEKLKKICKERIELKVIKTSGDLFLEKELKEFSGQGAFVKELDNLIVKKKLDIAVHSTKDIPTDLPKELTIGAVLKRASREDVFISKYNGIEQLPKNAIIGTSSTRRKAQLLRFRNDLQIKNLRGNVETRIRKLKNGEYDAIFLAKAGLERLGLLSSINYKEKNKNSRVKKLNSEIKTKEFQNNYKEFSMRITNSETAKKFLNYNYQKNPIKIENSEIKSYDLPFITSAGQGAIGVVCRKNSKEEKLLKTINHEKTMTETEVERIILKELGGGCIVPFGISAFLKGNKIKVKAEILSLDGKKSVSIEKEISVENYKNNGLKIVRELKEKGGDELIKEIGNQ